MPKRTFTPAERMHLTELAHAATLAGLMSARRWSPGEIKFQGGTSLHLVYGSPRFSEDLDFAAATTKGLHSAMTAAAAHVAASFAREFPRIQASLKARDEEFAADPRNPRLFTLVLSEPDWYEVLRVKVEFYLASEAAVAAYRSSLRPLQALRPQLRVDIPQVAVEAADLEEILCDKLHALGERSRIKARDIFDLWWICQQTGASAQHAAAVFAEHHAVHLAMYPAGHDLPGLADALQARGAEIAAMVPPSPAFDTVAQDITRWLPTAQVLGPGGAMTAMPSPLSSQANIVAMLEHAARCATATAQALRAVHAGRDVDMGTDMGTDMGMDRDTDGHASPDRDGDRPDRPNRPNRPRGG